MKKVSPKDILLLCSDGLQLRFCAADRGKRCAHAFLWERRTRCGAEGAGGGGGPDNITVLLMQVEAVGGEQWII